ncbi:MAG: cytochrome c oxidase subunit II [Pseudomonadota bacterium]|nr:cytochrome c oxidase subunit II [Pseudomonadota bacterium]
MVNSFFVCIAMIFMPCVWADMAYNMPRGVTPMSHKIYDLHMLVFYVCLGIAIGVFFMLFYAIYAFRKRANIKVSDFHESLTIELLWTVIPLILVCILIVPTVQVMFDLHDTSKSDITIKVTGIQWKWRYDYMEDGINFQSNLLTTPAMIRGEEPKSPHYLLEVDEPLVLPVHTKVRFLFTSNDVMHSWWVPELGVKKDCVPGYINESWVRIEKPGIYRGQCTELCGMQHGYMPIVVKALSKEDYQAWLQKRKLQKQVVKRENVGHELVMLAANRQQDMYGVLPKDLGVKKGCRLKKKRTC